MLLMLSACGAPEGGTGIPSEPLGPPAARYLEAAEDARIAIRAEMERSRIPGLSVAVGIEGEMVWSEGFGWADLTLETPVTPATRFPVGSVSQALTSVAVGRLVERGVLDLDAPVQRYVPSFPEKRWTVTLRDLMGHVSGVRPYGWEERRNMGACDEVGGALDVIESDSLQFEPGLTYRYSGAGWTLVGAAVQAAAGEPYQAVMRREVFAPLGMDATVPGDADATPSDRARPYDPHPFRTVRLSHAVDYSCQLPAEGYLSTPTDLVRFGLGLLDGRAVSDETRQVLWTPRPLVYGSSARYGLGWSVGTVRFDDDAPSSPMVQNSGNVVGGRTTLLVYPEQEMVLAVSGNLSYRSVASLASDLAERFFAASGG